MNEVAEHPPANSIWRHRKGFTYTVIGVGVIEATGAPCVVYKSRDANQTLWVRPLAEFMDGRFTNVETKDAPPPHPVGTVLIYIGQINTAEGQCLTGERAVVVEGATRSAQLVAVKFSNPECGRYHTRAHAFYPHEFVVDPTLRTDA